MDVDAYLDRIGFVGRPRTDLDTLRRIHRGHVEAIPYENLDVQLGVPVPRDVASAFDKLVTRRRGGWCFEMNGLLAGVLEEIGFAVTPIAAAVERDARADAAVGNHLVLRVDLDRPYLADVGFGDGLVDPVPIVVGSFAQRGLAFGLERTADGWWRLLSHPRSGAASFDFPLERADDAVLARQSHALQTDPASGFVQNAVVQRHLPAELVSLRGRVLRRIRGEEAETTLIDSAEMYARTLSEVFALDLPEAATLWPKVVARHAELFGDAPA